MGFRVQGWQVLGRAKSFKCGVSFPDLGLGLEAQGSEVQSLGRASFSGSSINARIVVTAA